MPHIAHGAAVTPEQEQGPERELASSGDIGLAFEAIGPEYLRDFGFCLATFKKDEANLLPQSPDTLRQLKALGRATEDPGTRPARQGTRQG